MNWEDEAFEESGNRGNAFTGPETGAFVDGAEWQRVQLRTNEAVERVAQSIWERNHGRTENPVTWESTYEPIRELWREDARAALDALLGED